MARDHNLSAISHVKHNTTTLRVLRLATISLCRNLQWGGAQLTDQRAYITTDDIHKPRACAITTQRGTHKASDSRWVLHKKL